MSSSLGHRICNRAASLALTGGVLTGLLFLAAAPSAAGPGPIGKTYFSVLVGFEEPHSTTAGCVTFTVDEMCVFLSIPPNTLNTCGTWGDGTKPTRRQFGFPFEFDFLEPIDGGFHIDGDCRVDRRAAVSSLACVGRLKGPDGKFNFGLSGRPLKEADCLQMVEVFSAASQQRQAQAQR